MDWMIYKVNRKKPESEIAFKKLSKKNQEAITKWLFEKEINSKAEKRGKNRKRAVIKFLSFVKNNSIQRLS